MKLYESLRADGCFCFDMNGNVVHESPGVVLHMGGTKFDSLAALAVATRVEVTNVHHYLAHHPDEEWPHEDFPNVALPWPSAWIEFAISRTGQSYGKPVEYPHVMRGDRAGLFAASAPDADGGWRTMMVGFRSRGSWAKPMRLGFHAFGVDPSGRYYSLEAKGNARYGLHLNGPEGTLEGTQGALDADLKTAFLALSFLHCKNVSLVEHATPPKVAAKRAKAGKPIGVTYKTLVIDGMKETLRTEGGIAQNGLKKALHICRGHFATYTADKPLFGKVVGTVWKPMHTRGTKERGEVVKDYKVVAGKGTA